LEGSHNIAAQYYQIYINSCSDSSCALLMRFQQIITPAFFLSLIELWKVGRQDSKTRTRLVEEAIIQSVWSFTYWPMHFVYLSIW